MNKVNKKAIVFYAIGALLVIVSLGEFAGRSGMALHESTGVTKAIYWLIAGCTSLIMGHLTALNDGKQPENKNEQDNEQENENK